MLKARPGFAWPKRADKRKPGEGRLERADKRSPLGLSVLRAEELDGGYGVLLDPPDGALAALVFIEHPDLVHEGGFLHLGDVGDDEDLAEGALEALEGEQHVVAAVGVQAPEDLVEDEEA
jgi:hypothetical protein